MSTVHSRQAFGLEILKNSHPDIRRLKKESGEASLHGNKFWKSTFVLMDYLNECPPDPGSRILELGCGWGLGGIYCARQFGAEVIALDADDSVFPYLEHHARINGVNVDTIQMRFEEVTTEDLTQFDMIIGADICFWDSMVDPLRELLERAMEAGVERALLTDPGRPTFRQVGEEFQQNYDAVYTDWDVPEPHNAWGLVLDLYNS
ncbi:methyltransferase domain-containing protein [Pseudomaricurvus alkylphenolicus]|uniref:class I SAM-dependent methyltransferase n=1 Tax=Pseudomaricurvus alkylphenolicus TaxID=1306991 RepID=UPI001420281F|nr:methyltransferase domain-containing protein [Pseudomaricurvus alkylphenolicus]NIB39330.1 methyltransferase domain-containing protein [Pseudomaricurvus alkylphenolicus]